MSYTALTLITHSVTNQQHQPGDVVDLSHLTEEQIENLIKQRVIAKSRKSPAKKSVGESNDG